MINMRTNNTPADWNTHGSLTDYISADDIATLYRSGEHYTESARTAILNGERGNFRSDADAELYIMNRTADIIRKAENFVSRIVTDKPSRRQNGKGIAIAKTPRGRFAVIAYVEYTNDGRSYEAAELCETEPEAREVANEIWVSRRY